MTKTGSFSGSEEIYIRKRAANNWVVVDSPKTLGGAGGAVSSANGFTIHTFTTDGTFTAS